MKVYQQVMVAISSKYPLALTTPDTAVAGLALDWAGFSLFEQKAGRKWPWSHLFQVELSEWLWPSLKNQYNHQRLVILTLYQQMFTVFSNTVFLLGLFEYSIM